MRHLQVSRIGNLVLAGLFLSGLAACSTTSEFTTQVTSFQQWPAGVTGQHYRFIDSQPQNLEQAAYTGYIRNHMFRTGLTEAMGRQPARFEVGYTTRTDVRQQMVQRETGDYDVYPTLGLGMGFPYGYYGNPFYSSIGFAMAPRYQLVPVPYHRYSLTVYIRDRQQAGNEVFRASAVADSRERELPEVMPYLAASVFDQFPGQNGQVRTVEFERNKTGVAGTAPAITVKKP
ncbi:DUF4136 domain-containing protein [Advenella mimigardefordensis]|uniref:Putative membrane protein n=1 Tax=Advenella mimigardefordensis (strain DSM 17166 / LMG 22922 / DPN7) TaxID=1247726 RepID=W0PFY0_ADVMD|nr:DUF4136 domain-containing protein [Advenella mimigardefordensis]AHG64397.1 putative membrane protein [Advenella mimigardefordensis DPN7]